MRPHRWQPTRLPRPWDSPGKNTGVGCHFLLQSMKVKGESEVAQSCPTLSDPMDCSLPGSSVHGIFQARVLEWGAIAFSENIIQVELKLQHFIYPNLVIVSSDCCLLLFGNSVWLWVYLICIALHQVFPLCHQRESFDHLLSKFRCVKYFGRKYLLNLQRNHFVSIITDFSLSLKWNSTDLNVYLKMQKLLLEKPIIYLSLSIAVG